MIFFSKQDWHAFGPPPRGHFIGEEFYGMLENSRIQDIQNGVRDLSREELDVLMIPHDS